MNFMKPSSTVVRSADSYRDFTLQMLEIKPFAIQEQKCPQICKCPICQRRSTPQVRKNSETPQRSGRMMRRFSIEGFKDEFLFICQMLQKTDTAIRPLNIRIHDTLFLKDRDLHMLVYYDNGLQFMRQKLYLSTETEKFFVDRRNQFELKRQIEQIEQGCHDRYTYKQYMEMNNIVTQKLKTEIYHQSQMKNLLIARYQSGDSLIMTQYEFHQMMYLTKTNPIFDSLIHLQLYLYNEQEGIMQPNLEDRNSKDFYIHKYVYKQDPQMFQDVLSEFSTLTNPSIRGEKQWKKEKAYMDNLELDQYFKYSGHKIAAYVECFHQVNIISMEIHFIINGPKSISIINIVKIQHCNAETLQWKIHQVHKVNTADKIRSNEFEILKQEYKPLTERGRALSNQMLQYTQRVVDKIRPITQKMTEDAERECQSNEAFIILNPKQSISCSIHKILGDKQYDKLLGNFPKQMIRLQKNTDKIIWKKKKDEPDNNKELVLEDYLVKTTMRKKPRIEIQSRFQRSISKKFFRSSY